MGEIEGVRLPDGTGLSQAEPKVSAVPASIPDAEDWIFTHGSIPTIADDTTILVLGRMGDVYGPVPAEMVHIVAWWGQMGHYSHDLIAYAVCKGPVPVADTQAIEARRAETGTGSVHESAVGTADAPKDQSHG